MASWDHWLPVTCCGPISLSGRRWRNIARILRILVKRPCPQPFFSLTFDGALLFLPRSVEGWVLRRYWGCLPEVLFPQLIEISLGSSASNTVQKYWSWFPQVKGVSKIFHMKTGMLAGRITIRSTVTWRLLLIILSRLLRPWIFTSLPLVWA